MGLSKEMRAALLLSAALIGAAALVSVSIRADAAQQAQPTATPAPIVSTAPTPTTTPEPEPIVYEGALELPVQGATGYAIAEQNLYEDPAADSAALAMLPAGTPFTILEESGGWWQVQTDTGVGWVQHDFCLINLPDVLPSIIYQDTNSEASVFRASGVDIPGITGQALYDAASYNARFGTEMYNMAVLYATAKKLAGVQVRALADGYTLVLYEGFRPYDTQIAVAGALEALAMENETVRAGIATDPWSIEWFIATGVSNHQQGYAVDVSLARVTGTETAACGPYAYTRVTGYEELAMPTAMHELSTAAASLERPVASSSLTEWRRVAVASGMNAGALRLRAYCIGAGLTPLASEWWHFNDLDRLMLVGDSWRGDFTLSENRSEVPE